jgi:hypothetical protein
MEPERQFRVEGSGGDMSAITILGALLLLGGLVWMAAAAINRGRLSDPDLNPGDAGRPTLEPRHRGLAFLGLGANWPGLVLVVLGAVLLLLPLLW